MSKGTIYVKSFSNLPWSVCPGHRHVILSDAQEPQYVAYYGVELLLNACHQLHHPCILGVTLCAAVGTPHGGGRGGWGALAAHTPLTGQPALMWRHRDITLSFHGRDTVWYSPTAGRTYSRNIYSVCAGAAAIQIAHLKPRSPRARRPCKLFWIALHHIARDADGVAVPRLRKPMENSCSAARKSAVPLLMRGNSSRGWQARDARLSHWFAWQADSSKCLRVAMRTWRGCCAGGRRLDNAGCGRDHCCC